LIRVKRRITMTNVRRGIGGSVAILALSLSACTSHSVTARTYAGGTTHTTSPPHSVPRLGVVYGSLLVTEPVSGRRVPWHGVVVLQGKSDYRVDAQRDGVFRLSVQPGSYVLTGRNLRFDDGAQFCLHRGGHSVTVRPGAQVHANVDCLTTLG
jgi:hypothetical protein